MTKRYLLFTLLLTTTLATLLLLSAVRSRASPQSDAPGWMYAICGGTNYVTVGWFNPSEEVLPFQPSFPAFLTALWPGGSDTYIMTYLGPSDCPLYPGCVVYRWRTAYDMPPAEYTLDAYVINMEGDSFYVEPRGFDPGCYVQDNNVFLPIVEGGFGE